MSHPQRSSSSSPLGQAVVLLIGLTVLQRLVGLARNIAVCRLLDPAELGLWNLANSFLILAAPLVVLGIPGSFNRYLAHYQQRGQLHAFIRRTLLATSGLAILGAASFYAFRRDLAWLAFGFEAQTAVVVTVALTLVFVVGFNAIIELLTALRQVRAVAIFQLLNSLLFLAGAVVLVRGLEYGAVGVVWSYALACGGTLLGMAWFTLRQVAQRPADDAHESARCFWQKLMPFAGWFWLSDLLTNLFAAIDRYMIMHCGVWDEQTSLAMVGQYHSSQILGTLVVSFLGMLASVLLSYVSHDWESGERERAVDTLEGALKGLCLTLTAGSAIAILAGPWIFQVALAGKYNEGWQVLPTTMAYSIWFGLLPVAKNYLWCRERAWIASSCIVAGLVTNIGLNAWWLPWWGLAGAVAATAVANFVSLLLVLTACRVLGMRQTPATYMALAVPGTLCLGPYVAIASVIVLLGWGATRGQFWSVTQQLWIEQHRQRLQRFSRQWWDRRSLPTAT